MVEVFGLEGPVTTRLGTEGIIEIPAMHDPDLDRFISGVIAFVRDPAADVPALVATAQAEVGGTIEADFFPFTNEAIDALKSNLTQMMTPREITLKMTRALGRAFRGGKPAILPEAIQ